MKYDGSYHKLFSNPKVQLELNFSQVEDLAEVKNMLRNRVKEWENRFFKMGICQV